MSTRRASRLLLLLVVSVLIFARPTSVQANPFDERITPLEAGDRLPPTAFVDQFGHTTAFSQFSGRTTVVGFIFTRCKDECPLTTQRFLQLDQLLGKGAYALVLVTIDPGRDTPGAIAAYAAKYHVAERLRIFTGQPKAVNQFVRSAGISVIDNGSGDLIHNTELLIIDPSGRIADVVNNESWNPQDIAAVVRHVSGKSSNFFARIDFTLTNAIAGLCGGSYQTASGILDALGALAVIVAGILAFGWMRRRVFAQGS